MFFSSTSFRKSEKIFVPNGKNKRLEKQVNALQTQNLLLKQNIELMESFYQNYIPTMVAEIVKQLKD